jgi:dTDP-4-amino-4,6-dideoxygalactose transaminase
MEEMCERPASQLEGRELNVRIKEMHAHMRCTELKEEEEELQEREEALKKREEEFVIRERELEKQNKKSCTSFDCTQ